jgi:hypothetical protein
MSSIYGYILYFLTLYIIIADTQPIETNDEIIFANYRHHFEHSTNIKKFRWGLNSRYNKAYCQFCNLVVPVVRFLY